MHLGVNVVVSDLEQYQIRSSTSICDVRESCATHKGQEASFQSSPEGVVPMIKLVNFKNDKLSLLFPNFSSFFAILNSAKLENSAFYERKILTVLGLIEGFPPKFWAIFTKFKCFFALINSAKSLKWAYSH